jgi:Holliday junction resolvasome RuvABC ATP-dependent DNA helicase subunit
MDVIRNLYAPSAGTRPPGLAGRDAMREKLRISIGRLRVGRPAKRILMVRMRGVGKTTVAQIIF